MGVVYRAQDTRLDGPAEDAPALARSLLRRCLAKARRHRLHDIADARIEISDAHLLAHHGGLLVGIEWGLR